jgi:hypothetical protein
MRYMKIKLQILGLLLFALACTRRTDQANTHVRQESDSLAYVIVKLVLTDTSMYGKEENKILSETPQLPPPPQYDGTYISQVSSVLSESDTVCISRQLKGSGKFSLTTLDQYGFTIVNLDRFRAKFETSDAFWAGFNKTYGDGFFTVSKPIFNCDRTKAFIRVGYLCQNECGGGSEMLLQKVGSNWILSQTISSWVS